MMSRSRPPCYCKGHEGFKDITAFGNPTDGLGRAVPSANNLEVDANGPEEAAHEAVFIDWVVPEV